MSANVILFYRNFMHKKPHHCHIGLGVNTSHTVKVLKSVGTQASTIGIWDAHDIDKILKEHPECTHAVIEAPFIGGWDMRVLVEDHPNIKFICRCHSQISFLQVEAGAIKLIRDYLNLQHEVFNFAFACNSLRAARLFQGIYSSEVLYLPNLYYINPHSLKPQKPLGKLIRVGSFGAIRIQKNHIGAAAASMLLAKNHNLDLEFYMNINREENGKGVLQAVTNMFTNIPWAKLIEVPWMSWPDFQRYISVLDLHIQVSMSETFNITTADATSNLIPTVVSSAIDWAPQSWRADIDDPEHISHIGWNLISNPHESQKGLSNLKKFIKDGTVIWEDYLQGKPQNLQSFVIH